MLITYQKQLKKKYSKTYCLYCVDHYLPDDPSFTVKGYTQLLMI